MWNAIKKVASAIFKPAPKPTPGGIVKTFTNPNLGQLAATGNPQANNANPQGNNYNPSPNTFNPQPAAKGVPAVNRPAQSASSGAANTAAVQAAAKAQAAREQAAREHQVKKVAATGVLNKLSDAWRQVGKAASNTWGGTKHAVLTPARWYAADAENRRLKGNYEKEQKDAQKRVNAWRDKYMNDQQNLSRQMASGQITPEQAQAADDANYSRFKGKLKNTQDYFSSVDKQLGTPLAGPITGKFLKGVDKLAKNRVVGGTISKFWDLTTEAPGRFVSKHVFRRNDGNFIGPDAFKHVSVPFGSQTTSGQKVPQQNLDKVRRENAVMVDQALKFLFYGGVYKAGGRFAGKGIGLAGKAWRGSKFAAPTTKAINWTADTKIGRAAKWVNAEKTTKGERLVTDNMQANETLSAQQQRLSGKINGFFTNPENKTRKMLKGYTDEEIAQYQQYVNSRGKAVVSARAKQLADEFSKIYAKQRFKDSQRGIQYARGGRGKWYKPEMHQFEGSDTPNLLRSMTRLGKRNLKVGFAQSKKTRDQSTVYNREDLIKVHAQNERNRANAWYRMQNQSRGGEGWNRRSIVDDWKTQQNTLQLRKLQLNRMADESLGSYNKSKRAIWDTGQVQVGGKRITVNPLTAWKQGVLKYAPTWYENNIIHNATMTGVAGGPKALLNAAKNVVKPSRYKHLPKDVVESGGKFNEGAGATKLGQHSENAFRAAIYEQKRAAGLGHDEAVKAVDKYLFNYKSLKNWERPLKAVIPFWRWQKNSTRLAAQLPFKHPNFVRGYQGTINELQTKPVNELPEDQRDFYKDKIKIKGKWYSSAGIPLSPEQMNGLGVNPFLSLAAETGLNKDHFGGATNGKSWWQRLSGMTQPTNLAYAFKHRNDRVTKSWIAEGEGYGKQQQGYDPGAAGFNPTMDMGKKALDRAKSYLGVRSYTFDSKRYGEDKRFKDFMKEYTALGRVPKGADQAAYDANAASREALAKKYGFDLKRDIYNGKFARNDTEATTKFKNEKVQTQNAQKAMYTEFAKVASATNGKGAAAFEQKMMDAVANGGKITFDGKTWDLNKLRGFKAFPNTPRSKVNFKVAQGDFWAKYWASDAATRKQMIKDHPEFSKYGSGSGKSQKARDWQHAHDTGDWSGYSKKYGVSKSQKQLDWQKATSSGDWSTYRARYGVNQTPKAQFWQTYMASDVRTRRKMIKEHPEYSKFGTEVDTPERAKARDLAYAYTELDPIDRKKYLADKYGALPTPAEGWVEFSKKLKQKNLEKLQRDKEATPGFAPAIESNKQRIVASMHKPAKRVGKPLSIKIAGFKALTHKA